MSETIDGAYGYNEEADFETTNDDAFYEEEGNGAQLYLESVLPQAYDPALQPFNTQGANPKKYVEQNEFSFHPKIPNPYAYTFDNSNKYFVPENKEQVF